MKWTCTKCGSSATGAAVGPLVARGWWITEHAGGLCPPCAQKGALSRDAETLKRVRSMSAAAGETRRARNGNAGNGTRAAKH